MTGSLKMYTPHRNMEPAPVDEWVDEEEGRVGRHIFTDASIYDLEIERIFNRCWLFLGHVTEIPNAGDYVTRRMGDDMVIVQRGEDGVVRAFINSCLHRGAQLCRVDAGNTKRFTCPYHAWSYDTTGKLLSTSFDKLYDRADLSKMRLTPVAQLDTYNGLIFATWDPKAPALSEFLGEMRWYLDLLFQRTPGGMQVLGSPQRWIVETNWKLPALNFGTDMQHAVRVHRGPFEIGSPAPMSALIQGLEMSPQVSFPQGHGCTLIPGPPGAPEFCGLPPELVPLYEKTLQPAQLGLLRTLFSTVGTLFPNTSWIQPAIAMTPQMRPVTFLALRVWQPLGPEKIEVCSWYFAEKEATRDWQDEALKTAIRTFAMAGIYEEDDTEVWASIVRSTKGSNARRSTMDFRAGLGAPAWEGFPGPGTVHPSLIDREQFNFLQSWKRHMREGSER